jgi:hypothetical protein
MELYLDQLRKKLQRVVTELRQVGDTEHADRLARLVAHLTRIQSLREMCRPTRDRLSDSTEHQLLTFHIRCEVLAETAVSPAAVAAFAASRTTG